MDVFYRAARSADKAVEWLRRTQHADGWWAGALRSNNTLWYAAALALDGEEPRSPVIQDICDYVESCAANDGGIGAYPGEPPDGFETAIALPLLQWARPHSPVLKISRRYLVKTWRRIQDPSVCLMRWIFEPAARREVIADHGPPEFLREVALFFSRRHPTERWDLARLYPRRYRKPSVVQRYLTPLLMRALTFPPSRNLHKAAASCVSMTGFDFMVLVSATLRRLTGDRTAAARRLYEFASTRRQRPVYQDGSYEWLVSLVADLFFTGECELTAERAAASAALRRIEYRRGGWLSGQEISVNVFDTGLAVLALRAAGTPSDDPMTARAAAFLRRAASSEHGMWSWSYYPGMKARRRYLDTDDTGLACMALASCGEPANSAALANAVQGLLGMQEISGAFSTFGDGALRPNWCWLSNTARALQALVASGLPLRHPSVARAVEWIRSRQQADGSWIDGWCARYIYGTVIALEALIGTKAVSVKDTRAVRAVDWLVKQQNPDGGWGEDWRGARFASTSEHTGLALYGLSLASSGEDYPRQVVEGGLNWLVKNQSTDGSWGACYFVNFGLNSGFANTQMPVVWALRGLAAAIDALTRLESANARRDPSAAAKAYGL
jgi:squalene-hopene/tetraprenyl-beta-curcumene cyclase